MEEERIYICKQCSKKVELQGKADNPVCCGVKMQLKLPQCHGVHNEMARNEESGEPCDDGRSHVL